MIEKLTQKGSLVDLILQGSAFAYIILGTLLVMSLISWSLTFYKFYYFHRVMQDSKNFLELFRQAGKITETTSFVEQFPMAFTVHMFHASHKEFIKLYAQFKNVQEKDKEEGGEEEEKIPQTVSLPKEDVIRRLERNIEKTIALQNSEQERGLSALAVISSSSPYLGILGTVTGVISAFLHIGSEGVTSLAAVAPGIAEALVTTAFGLTTAIPALIFYNLFRSKMRLIETEQYTFGLELINIYEKTL